MEPVHRVRPGTAQLGLLDIIVVAEPLQLPRLEPLRFTHVKLNRLLVLPEVLFLKGHNVLHRELLLLIVTHC